MDTIKRATIGGYIKIETYSGQVVVGRITGFDSDYIEFLTADGTAETIRRARAFKATAKEYADAVQQAEASKYVSEATEGIPEALEEADTAEDSPEGDEASPKAGAVKESYRRSYAKTKSASGNISLTCGDQVARILDGKTLDQVIHVLDELSLIFGEHITEREIRAKYANLNTGLARMSIGNRIRAITSQSIPALQHLRGMF